MQTPGEYGTPSGRQLRISKELLDEEAVEYAAAFHSQGLAANSAGDVQGAAKRFLQASLLQPAEPGFVLSAANMLLKSGQCDRAIPMYQSILDRKAPMANISERHEAMARSKLSLALAERHAGEVVAPAASDGTRSRRTGGSAQARSPPAHHVLSLISAWRLEAPPPSRVVGSSGREYGGESLWCLPVYAEPRRSAILLCESVWFDPFILTIILINCVTMAWDSPLDPPGTGKATLIGVMEALYIHTYIHTYIRMAQARLHS